VPKTLLAVDDSATMRKVLEICFAGEDFRVVTAEGHASALARMGEEPVAAVIDTSLGTDDGYSLAKEVRSRSARIAIVLLASRYTPYDPSRGREAGADDFIDKPFDTQTLIDKVKKALVARENVKPAPAPAPAPAPVTAPAGPIGTPAFGAVPRPPFATPNAARPAFATQRTHTLSFDATPAAPPVIAPLPSITRTAPSGLPIVQPPVQAAAPAAIVQPMPPVQPVQPVQPVPPASAHTVPTAAPPRTAEVIPTPVPAAPTIGATAINNGRLAGKLTDLGLTPVQVEAVLALSREVVEKVVWEVVPQLAETIIKEEIVRLTRDG
jgi:CheY-like chemotaxis protein